MAENSHLVSRHFQWDKRPTWSRIRTESQTLGWGPPFFIEYTILRRDPVTQASAYMRFMAAPDLPRNIVAVQVWDLRRQLREFMKSGPHYDD